MKLAGLLLAAASSSSRLRAPLLLSLADHPEGDCLSETVLAIYKPRGVLSAASDNCSQQRQRRRTLGDLIARAGMAPLPGHVGRLDAETSGLILVTSHPLLLQALLNWPQVLAEHGGSAVEKRYRLLIAGQVEPNALSSLRQPLQHARGGREYHSDAAVGVEVVSTARDPVAATEYELLDRDDHAVVAAARRRLHAARQPARSRATGALVPAYIPEDGWLTQVDVRLAQGRHHQVRRLCTRAGLKLRHLRRESVGPIGLDGLAPGDVRELSRDEKRALYRLCLPRLLDAQQAWRTREAG